jgi:hypothetical protein
LYDLERMPWTKAAEHCAKVYQNVSSGVFA